MTRADIFGRRGLVPCSMQNAPLSLEQLIASLKSGAPAEQVARPVETWNPSHCGDSNIVILRDGTWTHEGVRITREPLVRLFASLLRKDEDGETYLVTPVEKLRVQIEDAPLLAVRADRHGQGRDQTILFTSNIGDVFPADADHPIHVESSPETGAPRPYVRVRGRLDARILRAPFLDLVEWAEPDGGQLYLWSAGARFALGSVT